MSLAVRLIARVDLKPSLGCVKGIRFDGLRRIGPAGELAIAYEDQGADEILLLDTTASLMGRPAPRLAFELAGWSLTIPLCVGGGVRTFEDFRAVLGAGAEKVAMNTAAVAAPGVLTACAEAFGSQAVVLGLDIKRRGARWEAYTHGGRTPSGRDALEWALEGIDRGAGEVVVTSVDRDGTGLGLDLAFLDALLPKVSVPVVASGGAGSAADVLAALAAGASAVAVGTLLHAGVTVAALKAALADAGVLVR